VSTLGASAGVARATSRPAAAGSVAVRLLPFATALTVLGLALLLLFVPPWVHLAMGLSGGDAWTATPQLAHELSDRTIAELFAGPGTFALAGPDGRSLYTADEAAHLRDVRLVLYGFLALAAASAVGLAWALRRHRADARAWRAVARGGAGLALALLVVGAIAALAFGAAFELFHRLLFPGGNFAFPADSNLIRLYPLGFWQLSSAALGVLGVSGGLAAWWFGRRRAAALELEAR
jgi:hypothetical protein